MVIEASLIFDYTISINYHVSIFENMGVVVAGPHPKMGMVVPRALLLMFLEIVTAPEPQCSYERCSYKKVKL